MTFLKINIELFRNMWSFNFGPQKNATHRIPTVDTVNENGPPAVQGGLASN